MALHSVDRSSEDRGTPAPNSHDASFISGGTPIINVPRTAHRTNSVNYTASGAQPTTAQVQLLNAQLTLVGYGTLNVSCPAASNIATATVFHFLNYTPIIMGFLNNANTTIANSPGIAANVSMPLPVIVAASIGSNPIAISAYLYCFVDATKVYANLLNTTGVDQTVTLTYYLYQQRSQL